MKSAEARAYWLGSNRLLLGATGGIVLLLLLAWVGPAGQLRATLAEEHGRRLESFRRWQDDFRGYHPITDRERESWRVEAQALLSWLPVATDDPSTMAELARALETPSTRDLQVQPGVPLESRSLEIEASMSFESPLGARPVPVRAVPLEVSFKCELRDLRHILGRLQARELPVIAESLRVRRLFGELDVRIDLILLVRGEVT